MKTEKPEALQALISNAQAACNEVRKTLNEIDAIATTSHGNEEEALYLLRQNLRAVMVLLSVIGITDHRRRVGQELSDAEAPLRDYRELQ
jgi:precorrin-6B methylase 1